MALLLVFALSPAALRAQELTEEVRADPSATQSLALARAAAARGDEAEALSRYLRVLATTPDNVVALAGAGQAAIGVGDLNAAAGFYARADALDPRNGAVKVGLAITMLQNGNARGALRLFHDAVELGMPVTAIAADRGLAYDLRGDTKRAQADYQAVLATQRNDEVVRRLALSQAIAGDRITALATLDPLLRKQDVPAWRTRAFVLALTGDPAGANTAAALVMPRDQVAELAPYLPRLAGLRAADKAAAIHLGRFPGERQGQQPPSQQQQASRPVTPPKLRIDRTVLAPPPMVAVAPAPVAAPPPVATPPQPSAAELAARAKADTAAKARADAKVRAAAKAKADALAQAKQEREEKAAALAEARKNPARHFVQVAGGANAADLPKAWDKLKDKWPKQLAGRTPWTMHYRFTNRLMIGPFPSADAAQTWVSERNKEGFATFRVSTRTGDEVERLD
ncbi:tetratricopeptide repeat protein [uncultured Sphingomonas sp.]|uniref:SPOR domain-containing protein n=1 Tax=uncultured Sphingomonas sp. TaxID=158754 RepID=UPI0025FF3F58|nr:tetratricopeptide repeat protein [uncultured Sphingomonas sp.]